MLARNIDITNAIVADLIDQISYHYTWMVMRVQCCKLVDMSVIAEHQLLSDGGQVDSFIGDYFLSVYGN